MPSRKRAKSKARKAKAILCRHGCEVISKDDICYKFVEQLEIELNTVTLAMNHSSLLESYVESTKRLRVMSKYKAIFMNNYEENQQKLQSLLVNLGTKLLLRDHIDSSHLADIVACAIISVIYPPHNFALTRSFVSSSECRSTLRDLENGMPYDCLKFFYKKSSCQCLEKLYLQEKSKKRFAYCKCCKDRKERSQLFLCSDCLFTYYCGVECQTKHWSVHQPMCKETLSVLSW